MNPYDTAKTLNFSSCSRNMICQKIGTIGRCLETPGFYETASKFVCGNGIREGNEECDCGGATACAADPCCNSNCTFKAAAVCSPKHDTCCSATCGYQTNGTLCRPTAGPCDVAEYCNGTASSCPADKYVTDGTSCTTADTSQPAKCASGQCTSRELYCKARNPTISLVNDTGRQQQLITGECLQFGKTCSLFCASAFGECYAFNDYFLPGTDCGDGGVCMADGTTVTCSNPDFFTRTIEWIRAHLTIVVPIAAVLVTGLIFISTRYCFRRSRLSAEKTAKHIVKHDDSVLSLDLARANREFGSELDMELAQARRQSTIPAPTVPPPSYIQATAYVGRTP